MESRAWIWGGEEGANQLAPGPRAYQNMPGYMLANDNAPTSHAPSPGEAHWPSKGFRSGSFSPQIYPSWSLRDILLLVLPNLWASEVDLRLFAQM